MRILLVTPTFHGYWRSIAAALRRRGHEVRVHRYDELAGAWAKVRHKLAAELPARAGRDVSAWRARRADATLRACLVDSVPDVTVVIKGDVFSTEGWADIERLSGTHVLWLYDEVRRTQYDDERLRLAGRVASYSRRDTSELRDRGLATVHLPNAFDPADRPAHGIPIPAVSFVGARYPNREEAMMRLRDSGVSVLAVGRDWSHHPVDRVRTWSWRRPDLPAHRDVPRATAYGVMQRSTATLNPHFDQDGFTMRTFEAPGVGGLQLIDRPDVSDLYEPGREVVVYRDLDELVDLARRAARDRRWAEQIRAAGRRRTLSEHTFDHRMAALESLWA